MAEGSVLLVDWLGRSAVVFPVPVGADLAQERSRPFAPVSLGAAARSHGGVLAAGRAEVPVWRRRGSSRDFLAIAVTARGEGLAGRAGGVTAVPVEGVEELLGRVWVSPSLSPRFSLLSVVTSGIPRSAPRLLERQ